MINLKQMQFKLKQNQYKKITLNKNFINKKDYQVKSIK